jgi:thiamine pyrophosphate-dependent acetolactate synthase large subunit-like protein
VVFNNQGYACIRDLLTFHGWTVPPELSSAECANYDIGNVSLAKLASDFGINAQSIEDPTEIRPALEKAIALEKPALLEIMINPDQRPMLELGAALAS